MQITDSDFTRPKDEYSWFSRDVINILKCKITEALSFQLSLVIKHAKYIYF